MEPNTEVDLIRYPWDRQPDEPTRWYSRFCIYLSLGTTRSLEKAVAVHNPKAAPHSQHDWHKHFARWKWNERATAYDVHHFMSEAKSTVMLQTKLVHELVVKALAAVKTKAFKVETVKDVSLLLGLLREMIPPEAISQIAQDAIAAGNAIARVPNKQITQVTSAVEKISPEPPADGA